MRITKTRKRRKQKTLGLSFVKLDGNIGCMGKRAQAWRWATMGCNKVLGWGTGELLGMLVDHQTPKRQKGYGK
jgi:hypothetical protein